MEAREIQRMNRAGHLIAGFEEEVRGHVKSVGGLCEQSSPVLDL